MRLYYTVASQPEAAQTKTNISLGGYKSSSPLPNSTFGNLFGDISMYTVKNAYANKYIGLVLKNESIKDVVNAEIWFVYPTGCASKFRVAAVDMALDGDGQYYMEHIPENTSKPLYAEFFEADGDTHKFSLGDLAIGEVVGIWIERELDITALKLEQNAIYQVNPNDPYLYQEVVLPTEDLIELHFGWELPAPAAPIGDDITEVEVIPIQTLTAVATAPTGAVVVWYDATVAGNVVVSPTLSAVGTITYYAESQNTLEGKPSVSRTAITLTLTPIPD